MRQLEGHLKKLALKKYHTTVLGQCFLGITMMHAPKIALEVVSHFVTLIITSFLADCGITDLESVALCCPSPTTIKCIMLDEGVDTISLETKRMKNTNITLLGNKGEGESKRCGAASFVRLVVMHDAKQNHASVDAAVGIDHFLNFYDYGDAMVILSKHTNNVGIGGTWRDLALKLSKVNRAKNMETYIYTT